MAQSDLQREAAAFFDDFVDAFATFRGSRIAERYVAPYVALQTDGSVLPFTEHSAIGAYFQSVVDTYAAQGCRSCRYRELETLPLGRQSALATVTWDLLREDGTVLTSWRESYALVRKPEGLRIFTSVDHVAQ